MKALYGIDALPRSLPLDDPRLPSVTLGPTPLRLNTHPVPAAILANARPGHDAHRAALAAWLLAQAGDWAAARRRLLTTYLDWAAAEIADHHDAIAARLTRYDGLYAPQDYLWSALRPLPRAWLIQPGAAPVFADIAFWDGTTILTAPFPPGPWPEPLQRFWRHDALPSSPFRRPLVRENIA